MRLKQVEETAVVRPTLPVPQTATATEHARTETAKIQRRRATTPVFLSRKQKRLAVWLPVAYGGYLCLLEHAIDHGPNAFVESLFMVSFSLGACLLCLWLGAYLRYKRAGAFAGAWAGFNVMAGMLLVAYVQFQTASLDNAVFALVCTFVGMVLGIIGASLGQWLRGRPTHAQADNNR